MDQLTIHLSILLFWPLALALLGATIGPRSCAPGVAVVGAARPARLRGSVLSRLRHRRRRPAVRHRRRLDRGARHPLQARPRRAEPVAGRADHAAVRRRRAVDACFRPVARPRLFAFHLALAETAVLGAFLAQDLALFVLFFDLMLVPFYFLVGQWGSGAARTRGGDLQADHLHARRLAADARRRGRDGGAVGRRRRDLVRALRPRARPTSSESTQRWIFVAFALAFLIKMPAFPFHGWMPDAYRTMPLPALAIFSGVLSKVAAYGFLRIVLPLFPDAAQDFQTLILVLALLLDPLRLGAGVHADERAARARLLVGRAARLHHARHLRLRPRGPGRAGRGPADGQPRARGRAAVLHHRAARRARGRARRTSRDMGGLAFRAPVLAALFLIAALATLAMPGSANFVGEFLILLGLFQTKLAIAIIAFTGVAMASVYMLRMYIRTMHNRVGARAVDSRELTLARRARDRAARARHPRLRALPAGRAERLGARRQGRDPGGGAMTGPAHRLGGALAAGRADRRRLPRADGRAAAPAVRAHARSCRGSRS